ncbi:glycerophosphoryl diester phosphodiesterase membrane domain-containing protein [Pseudoclavibacter sp. 13-3]|uniref:glycerophosphoryl diester phosphodiesterase membrane domain-containing protein n=1 Tax=Pseudoclavibacter sp. 13-3 TaxID=2901228 RepID=UPI001E3C4F55|nr:glycerophosphoryl diester phosphodiesterase membrane domain-containing protein [Pseudoclavibacter sp. 13-3]MCD7100939.1 glycerophosphoryl diester phosphodiesterase membrane domain-containing protein [Pseudoclavibacter sp. 13-3]
MKREAGNESVRLGLGALLRATLRTVRRGGIAVVAFAFLTNIVLVVAAEPFIGFLFREALLLSGEPGVDFGQLRLSSVSLLVPALIVLIGLFAFVLVTMQLVLILLALQQTASTGRVSVHDLLISLGGLLRRLLRVSSLPVFCYLFLLLPISGFGFLSALTQVIAVPNFVSGELLKNPVTAALWNLLMLALLIVNIRLALTLPIFARSDASGSRAMRVSWRTVHGRTFWTLVAGVLVILLIAAPIAVTVAVAMVLPTAITDHLNPAVSPVSAAISAGVAQVLLILLLSTVTVALFSMLTAVADQAGVTQQTETSSSGGYRRAPWRWGLAASAALMVIPLSLSMLAPMQTLASPPQSEVIGHRGFVAGGVENTIPALEAAAQAGIDRVEIDAMQTKDGNFIVMHDLDLSRLAGRNEAIKDLTLAELTQITVHDEAGHSAKIPSLEEYVVRARELGMPLLIEVKMGGLDSPDHVDLLVQQLKALNALDGTKFHSLDHTSVARLKELLPDAEVGYILSFAGVGVPDTPADFLVIEEYTATEHMRRAAAKACLKFYVWTVDDELAQRVRLRQGVDAMITDRPDTALSSREEMQSETGLAPALLDLLLGFVAL